MSIRQTIMILGFFLIIQPFLGFTSAIDTTLNIIVGLLTIILAYRMFPVDGPDSESGDNKTLKVSTKKDDLPFVEHKDSNIPNNNSVS